jgi:hypothetical protein
MCFLRVEHDQLAWPDDVFVATVCGRNQAVLGECHEELRMRMRVKGELGDRGPEQFEPAEVVRPPHPRGAVLPCHDVRLGRLAYAAGSNPVQDPLLACV